MMPFEGLVVPGWREWRGLSIDSAGKDVSTFC
jgi:hypothetical protein